MASNHRSLAERAMAKEEELRCLASPSSVISEPLPPSKDNDSNSEVRLKADMTLLNGCNVIVGCIIGSGIFVSPTGVLASTGSVNLSLVVWVVCGVFTMFGAYCYAELGCMIRKSGADYAYIHVTFGPFLAFIRLWVECIIVRPCSAAIQALTFSLYILKPMFPECSPPDDAIRLLAAVCICFLCFINCYEVKWANRVQDYFTYAKVFALIVIVITGLVQLYNGHTEHFTWEGTETDVSKIALSFYSGLFAYTGWNFLNFIIEEMKNPVRDLPRAIGISCTLCLVIYVLTIVAFHTTLSKAQVLGSEAVAVTFADAIYGRAVSWVIPVFVACSTFGAVNGTLLTSSRLFFSGAREGQMPKVLTMIQTSKLTPTPSVLCVTLLALIYLLVSDIAMLMNYVGFATWLSIGAAVLCLPYLRWKRPDMERPIRVSLIFPIVYLLLTVAITTLPMMARPAETGIGVAMILTAVPVYAVFIAWRHRLPETVVRWTETVTTVVQKLFIVVPPAPSKEN